MGKETNLEQKKIMKWAQEIKKTGTENNETRIENNKVSLFPLVPMPVSLFSISFH